MRIHLTERGASGDDEEHYMFETDLDVSNEDEAYVKGREWDKLTAALARGFRDEYAERVKAREEADDG